MTRNSLIVLVVILMFFGFALWALLPIDAERLGRQGLNLGLDLVGGVVLCQVECRHALGSNAQG